ncbi:hypothetical protein [Paraburkholderia sp. BCC1886]|uniref:hypothetical protein n=1 Tax=Paraburkholderia sp. BCC1886 TaxID=2562670 RepID=UPI00118216D2|nr:hypothetical protein [Paraburkholderia sp. BCC1886]
MEFEQSALMLQVNQILQSGPNPVNHTVSASVSVTSTNMVVTPLKVTGVDLMRNYLDSYSDELIVELQFSGGTYLKYVYPYKNAIDITLTWTPLMEGSDAVDPNGTPTSETFTATLIDKGNDLVEQNGANSSATSDQDLTNIKSVHFQLVNKALDQMRMISASYGVIRSATVDDAIKLVLTTASQATTVNGTQTVQGVTMTPSNNQTARDHIVVPHGMKLVDLPQYIQKNCGGVYSASMGYFLQGTQWHVYPALDTTRFNTTTSGTLTVINVPQNKFPHVERTYLQSGNSLTVMATGQVKFRDPSNAQQLNEGNGIRFADATKFMQGGFAAVSNNSALASRGTNNSEFMAVARPSGNNNAHLSPTRITANALEEYSQLSRAVGSIITMEWQNSQPSLILPGMPAEILYLADDAITTLTGVVCGAHHVTQLRGQGISAARYNTSTVLNIFIQPQVTPTAANSTP